MLRKIIISLVILGFGTIALGDSGNMNSVVNAKSIFFGLTGGVGNAGWKAIEAIVHSNHFKRDYELHTSHDTGFAGGAFIGYDFNRYLAAQAEYVYFSNRAKLFGKMPAQEVSLFEVKTQALALMAKLKLPSYYDFTLYTKFGVDYLSSLLVPKFYMNKKTQMDAFNVAFGVGIDYNITPNLITGVSWTRYNGNPNYGDFSPSNPVGGYQPNADLYAFNFAYKFNFISPVPSEINPMPTSNDNHFYVGLTEGYGISGWKALDNSEIYVSNDKGFAGGAFIGYDFNKYLATQAEYIYFANKAGLFKNTMGQNVLLFEARTQALALMAKLKLPNYYGFTLFGKVGVDYLYSSLCSKTHLFGNAHMDTFDIAYGVGIDYNVVSNVVATLSWTNYEGESRIGYNESFDQALGDYQPVAKFYALGVAYKF